MVICLTMCLGLFTGTANATIQNINSWNGGSGGIKAVFENKVSKSFEDSVHFSLPQVKFGEDSNHVSMKYDHGISFDSFELWGDGKLIQKGSKSDSDYHLSFFGDKGIKDYELKIKGHNDHDDGKYCGEIVVSPVPEPQTYAMLLIGLGLVGFSARRRKDDAHN